jgi:hypothetical protein
VSENESINIEASSTLGQKKINMVGQKSMILAHSEEWDLTFSRTMGHNKIKLVEKCATAVNFFVKILKIYTMDRYLKNLFMELYNKFTEFIYM